MLVPSITVFPSNNAKRKETFAWSICIVIYSIAAIFFIVSLGIPDVPPTEDVTVIYEMDELADIEEVNLGNGWGTTR